MSVILAKGGLIALDGDCGLEDAETLLDLLLAYPQAKLDWRGCDSAHAAVIQVIMASGRPMAGPPRGEFLAKHLVRGLRRAQA